jgi:Flp pilus assembly protein TadG
MRIPPEMPTERENRNNHPVLPLTRRGAVLPLFAICLAVLLGVLAIASDGGSLLSERRHAQVTADAAALAAAADLYKNFTIYQGKDLTGTAKQAALDLAKANGYANDGASTVTVNIPPTSGEFSGKDGFAEVIVEFHQQRGFSAVIGSGDIPVRARAVARGYQTYMKRGLILLNPTATDSFHVPGNGVVDIVNGSVYVDSNADIAAHWSGNGTLKANSFEITGNYQNSGGAVIVGPINTRVPPVPDPLANLPEPNMADYPLRATQATQISSNGPVILSPGVYRGGIQISGNGAVTLLPGIYIMDGGGFALSGLGSLTGTEVMIYNRVRSDGDHGQILVSGNGAVTLTPPTSGTYQGMSIFQQRTQTDQLQISGNGNVTISGVVYAKAAKTLVSGNGLTAIDTLGGSYVCDTMQISGNGLFHVDLTGPGPPIERKFSLVE